MASADEAAAAKAIGIIQELTATAELNKTYLGKVQRITDFGAFVEIMPGTDGLLHVSEIAHHRVKDVRDELKEGQQVLVKVINIDPTGKIRLSRKALITPEEGAAAAPAGGDEGDAAVRRREERRRPSAARSRSPSRPAPRLARQRHAPTTRAGASRLRRFCVRPYNSHMSRLLLAAGIAASLWAVTAGVRGQEQAPNRREFTVTASNHHLQPGHSSRSRRTTW